MTTEKDNITTVTNPPPSGEGTSHDHQPAVVKVALTVAGGSAAGLAGLLVAAGQAAISTMLAGFAIGVFAVIMLAALAVAAAYALRRR